MKLGDLKPNGRNPRKITQKQLAELKRSLDEFGDLGGIVVNKDGTLISGHQRFDAMRASSGAKIVDIETLDLPSETGTIERAWVVLPSGERFSWRRVDWGEQKAQLAMLAANKQGGEWAMDKLADAFRELRDWDVDLDLTGFDVAEREHILGSEVSFDEMGEPTERLDQLKPIVCPSCGHEFSKN